MDCSSLTSINIPDGVTNIGAGTFWRCSSLTSINIPNSVTSIGYSAFRDCSNLTSITIPDGVTSIGDQTFEDCSSLMSINIPNSVTSIGYSAFRDCSNLTSITIPDGVTSIGSSAFGNTAYYNNPNNWSDNCLYIDNCLIDVNENIPAFIVKDSTTAVDNAAFAKCYSLIYLKLGGSQSVRLSSLTNLETLVITEMPTHYIYEYFGDSLSDIPLTLKSIVLEKNVRLNSSAFAGITGITIYVEATENDTRWDENFPGWNNGNKVVYGDEWITADFYDQNGILMSSEIFLTHQVIRQPYLELTEGLEESQVLVGWDLDGDGMPDTIPATSTVDIVAKPIIETRASEYTVSFFDTDGVTLISKVVLPYGAEIVAPAIEEKMGYITNGWTGYTEGMTVSGNHVFVLDRVHNGNGHDYAEPIWVAPTCTEQGYNKHVCAICGEWYATDYVEANGHDYVSNEIKSTCTESGEIRYTCTVCGHEYSEIIPAHGHNYVGTVTKEATCTEYGELLFVCEHCGDRVSEKTPMTAHNYQKRTAPKWWLQILIEKILNVFFGYEGDNIFYYKCVDCKHIQTAEESSTGSSGTAGIMSAGCAHQLSDWTEYIAPTCEGDGVDAKFCAVCEKAVEYRHGGEALGHDYSEHIVIAPTCTIDGYTTHTCSRCDSSYTDSETEALGHTEGDEVDCLHDQVCTVCGEILVGKLGHDYVAVVTEPTCTTGGYTTHTCSRCDNSYTDGKTEALGHTEGDEADCLHDQVCTVCDEILVGKLGHDYVAVVTEPTCTTGGYTTHTCSRCNNSYTDSEAEALGHKPSAEADCLNDQICTVCGIILNHFSHGGFADFNTINSNGDRHYDTYNTANGWTIENSAIQCGGATVMNPQFPVIGADNSFKAPCLNGRVSVPGKITSPILTGGISKLTLTYTKMFSDTKLSVTINVTDHATGTVYTHTVARDVDKTNDRYVVWTDEWVLETPITGNFTIVIVNDCPTAPSNRGRFTILSLVWANPGNKPSAEADCMNDQVCTVCGKVLTEKLGHDYKSVVTAPTCTEQGYTTHTCSRCTDAYTDSATEALGHTGDAEANCLNDQVCTVCGEVLTEKLGHDYKPVVTDPTCTEQGYTTHTCSRCNDTYTDSEAEALGHTPGVEADCVNDQVCTICGEVLVEKRGHNYKAVVTDPICTEQGYTTYTCTRCDNTYTDSIIEALGHTPSDWIVDTEAQIGVEGSKYIECTICGETLETGVIEALPVETEAETETESSTEVDSRQEDPKLSNSCSSNVNVNVFFVIFLGAISTLVFVKRREENC